MKSSAIQRLIVCLMLINLSFTAKAQLLTTLFQLNFNAIPTLVSGTANSLNAKYIFSHVTNTQDALVKIKSTTGGATVDIFDDNTISKPEGFSPKIKVPAGQTGLVEFEITFINTGSYNILNGNYVSNNLDSLFLTAIDIDGNSEFKEMDVIEVGGGTASYVSNNPEITVTKNGNVFTGKNIAGQEYDNVDTAAKQVMFTVKKNNVNTFSYKCGGVNSSSIAYSRQKSMYFKNFTYPPAAGTLPVKLAVFNITSVNAKALLNWSTTFEQNTKAFAVERSQDGQHFTEIGRVAASGNSNNEVKYSFTDNSPLSGKSFYRLQEIDLDSKINYSPILLFNLDTKATAKISVFPNPAKGFTVASITAVAAAAIQMQLIDATGKPVYTRSEKISKGFNSITLNNLEKLTPGYYTLRIINGNEISNSPLLIL